VGIQGSLYLHHYDLDAVVGIVVVVGKLPLLVLVEVG
jgi:hypothetical protein